MEESKYMKLSAEEKAKKIAYQQEYIQKNSDKHVDYYKDYYLKNRERLLAERQEKITCICGKEVSKSSLSQHMKTALHENNLNKIVKALLSLKTCEVIDLGNDELPKKKKYNEKSKVCTYTWRENNKERSKEIGRKGQSKYYEENKEKIRKYNLARYYEKKRKEKEQAATA